MRDFQVLFKAIALLLVFFVAWYLFESFLWGTLLFLAFLSLVAAMASMLDGEKSKQYIGSRLFLWFFRIPILIEVCDAGLGYLAGGTGTLTGLQYAIMTGLVASLFRELNEQFRAFRGLSFLEWLYESRLKDSGWQPKENFIAIFRNKGVTQSGQNIQG